MFYDYGRRGRPKVRVHCFACEARFELPGTRTDKGVRCPKCGEWNELGEPELQRVSKKTPPRQSTVDDRGSASTPETGTPPLPTGMTYVGWRIVIGGLALLFCALWWNDSEFFAARFHAGVNAIEAQWRALLRM